MIFGVMEMKKFAESSSDERVKAMWRTIEDLRSRAARWNASHVAMRRDLLRLRDVVSEEDVEAIDSVI